MSDPKFQLGAFVWYASKGIGRVEETGGSPSVLFWADRKSGKTEKLPLNLLTSLVDYIPEANPQGKAGAADQWKRFESGVRKAPLKLVALALSACGNSGAAADIKEKLDRRAPIGPWGSWWKRTEPKLGELPANFKIDRAAGNVEYVLLSSVSNVPADWIEPKVTTADWKAWLSSATHEPPPGRFPTKPVADALAKWPAKTIEQALIRIIRTVEEALAEGGVAPQTAAGWLRAVAQAASRLRETGGQDTRGYMAARVGTVLAQLERIAGDRTPHDLLLQAGALDGNADAWRRGLLAGMWEAFEGEDAREMYRRSAAVLGHQARGDLAREVGLAAFGPEVSDRRHSELDRLLDALPEAERLHILEEIIARAPADRRGEVQNYVANSRHADGPDRLPLRVTAALTLSEGQGELATGTARELAEALAAPDRYGPETQALLKDISARVEKAVADKEREIAELRQSHAAELERERREQEWLRQQVRQRNADLAARREESRLEIRRDMLLAIGEVLQAGCRGSDSEDVFGNVEAGLRLALKAGGAEVLDSAPEGYDVRFHKATETLAESTRVRVIAPGVIVRGGTHGDLVLLKAQVSREAV